MKSTYKKLLCLFLTLCFCASVIAVIPVSTAALKPYKTVSASYKESDFYTKLTSIELTGNHRYDVVNVALSQVGYHASDSSTDLGGSAYTGTKQYTQFGKDYGSNGVAWCVIFVSWCMRQAGVPTSVGPNQASCSRYIQWLKSNATYTEAKTGYVPVTGDLIFFCDLWENKTRYPATHVGYVVGIDKNYVYTVEGNANLSVLARKYDIDDPYIVGYGIPKYSDSKQVEYNFPYENIPSKTGGYVIPEGGLPVYAGPGKTYEQTGTVPAGTVVTGFTSLGFGRLYFNEDGTVSDAVVDTSVKTHTEYKEKATKTEGWFCLSDAEWVNPDGDEITLSFDMLGGSFASQVAPITVKRGEAIDIPADIPEKPHNKFLGWGVTKLDTAVRFNPGDKYTGRDSVCLYAVWDPEMISASFYGEDGKTLLATNSYAYGSAVTFSLVPTKPADKNNTYVFDGWSPKLTANITEEQKYTAVFKAVPIPPVTTTPITTAPITTTPITTTPITTTPVTTTPVTTVPITTTPVTTDPVTTTPITTEPITSEPLTTVPENTTDAEIISTDIITGSPEISSDPVNTDAPGTAVTPGTNTPFTRPETGQTDEGDRLMKLRTVAIVVISVLLIAVIVLGSALIKKK